MLVFGFMGLAIYSQSPGGVYSPPNAIDADVPIDLDRYTLVIAIHPMCPCTSSSLYELERLVAKFDQPVQCVIYVYEPEDQGEWFERARQRVANRFPGALIIKDENGKHAQSVGAITSGSVVLYSPSGEPLFWGGITSARGHAGDNLGSDAILAITNNVEPLVRTTPVYGCQITNLHCADSTMDICSGVEIP